MSLIVQKFGGSSVADANKIRNVCNIIADTKAQGHRVVVVLSAQGDTTDDLITKMDEITECASLREKDMLLSAGEQISVSLAAMCMESMGYPAVSLTGWQAGIRTTSQHTDAAICTIDHSLIDHYLSMDMVVFVAGFQGIDDKGNITTLGRGGSDTTAVALAAWLNADMCQIYTDVDGVYTADPRVHQDAKKMDEISYDEMLALIDNGAQVLHKKSVLTAKQHSVPVEVLSSFQRIPGTMVCELNK